jgi:hypothetical protein
LHLTDFIFGKSGQTSESIPYDPVALLFSVLSKQLYLEQQREWIILYKSPCDLGISFKRWMGRLLRLCNGKDGSAGCLNKAPLQITVLQRTISYLAVLQHRLVYSCKPFSGGFEITGEVEFDAISSTFNKLFDNLIGFM